jgi:AcrR family transcriptional regulator
VRTGAKGPAGRGRPADPGIERRVLAAALTVYGEVGWAGFTLDRVARRAPVGKAALYRRWPTKEDLLLAALEHLAEPPGDEADPTDLRGCLIGMTEQVIDMFVGPKALVLPRVLIEASQYPPRFDDMVQNIVRARFGTVRTVIQAAAERGELPPRTPPDLIIDAIMGRVISLIVLTPGARRATINAERDRHAASITDFVLGAITGLAAAAPDTRRGTVSYGGRQYMLYFIRDKSGAVVQTLGTQVARGQTANLDPSTFSETTKGSWTSPATGITYGSGWRVTVPGESRSGTRVADEESADGVPPDRCDCAATVVGVRGCGQRPLVRRGRPGRGTVRAPEVPSCREP